MNLLEHEELAGRNGFNFAPMIDFLFLMLALFATLAISRASLFDTEISLAEVHRKDSSLQNQSELQQVHLSIAQNGTYHWLTEFEKYPMQNPSALQKELIRQIEIGALPQDKSRTEILLHIDKQASWEPIAEAIFALKELGFSTHPVYEVQNSKSTTP